MIKCGYLYITDGNRAEIERKYGPIEALTDKDAKEIAQETIAEEITCAWFSDDESIYYEYDDGEYEQEIPRGWNEEYLNNIGMSMRDFL